MPKPNELERRIEELKLQNNELTKEISLRQEEISDLIQTIREKNSFLEKKKQEYKELLDTAENRKNDYVEVNTLPNQIIKDIDKISVAIELVSSFFYFNFLTIVHLNLNTQN